MSSDKGVPIRSLSRGLSVLQAINRGGSLTMTEITRACDLPFPTATRLIQTLIYEGLIEREPNRRRYRPTSLVQTLSHGFQGHGRLVKAARPHIVELTRSVAWPITLSTQVGHSMVIRDSTHSLSALTFNEYFPGYASPLLESAAGLAFLAAMEEQDRENLLHSMRISHNSEWDQALALIAETELLDTIREQGFAERSFNRFTRNPGKTSSIAAVVLDGGRPAGAVSLAYFASSMKADEAINRFAPYLQACAAAVSDSLGANDDSSA
ncbi:helix-turn-helix domain-containing protein [Pelagerythrobacter sp.]|uniref:helix-turn-helix domain-containing protein n=1 Tax=Pelagerythrobacter sp. TaxID=2800702 RepID=UPI0035B22417